ncbi:UBP28 hydrolase, partial [Polypterus senegalus]
MDSAEDITYFRERIEDLSEEIRMLAALLDSNIDETVFEIIEEQASNWDVSQAISLLTAQEPETEVTAVEPSATEGSAVGRDVEKNSTDVTHNDNDDLQAAIQLSLQESCCAQVEERDLNSILALFVFKLDVSEFTHKLLDWLEDAFQLTADGNNPAGKQENPMVQLFYGTFLAERTHNGKTLSNIERFGQYPLQVNGFDSLHECLEGAMVEGEIEALHSDQTIHSSQERWFSKLPPVLTFELSRFEFNQSLGRPEKIHKKLEFPPVIYMDRYLHKNMELTHTKRKEVKTLKEQMIFLQQRLESYLSYGSGPTKYPLADMLQYVLEFASTQPTNFSPTQNIRIAALPQNETITLATETPLELTSLAETETLTPQVDNEVASPACPRIPGFKPFTHCNTTTDAPPYPAPHSVTEEELIFIKSCLQRWRREVPYRLHAILVHEGQASAGHYWAYIFDHEAKRWLKYNDISVTESSWDELERDSFGGMKNARILPYETDVETGQVLKGLDSLPAVLRRYVWEDNRWFQQEVEEWNEEQFRKVPQKEHPVSMTAESQETTQSVNTSEDLTVQQTHRSLSEEHAGISKEQTAQAIANTAECYEKNGVEAALTESESEPNNSSGEAGMTSVSVSENTEIQEQSSKTDERPAESQVSEVEIPNVGKILVRSDGDGYNEEMMLTPAMQGVILAIAKARQVYDKDGPEAALIKAFHEEYSRLYLLAQEQATPQNDPRLQHVLVYLFQNNAPKRIIERTLLEQFADRNLSYDERSISIMKEARAKLRLIGPEDMDMDEYRDLNENAARLFDSGEETDVAECMRIMNDIVIPCMHLMITNDICKEDLDAIETLRNRWCSYLGQDIDAALQEKLGEFLPRLLDCSAEIIVLKEPPKIRPHSSHDLCSRFAAVMESIHGVTPVTVK